MFTKDFVVAAASCSFQWICLGKMAIFISLLKADRDHIGTIYPVNS